MTKFYGRSVIVNDGNVEKAIRKLKKKVQNSGILMDLRDKETYIKPTTKRKTAKSLAKKRWKKFVASQDLPQRKY
jgi:small subunit ribosomal protein S21